MNITRLHWSRDYQTLADVPANMQQGYVTIPEASRLALVPYERIRAAAKRGELPVLSSANCRRPLIRLDHVQVWLRESTQPLAAAKPVKFLRVRKFAAEVYDSPAERRAALLAAAAVETYQPRKD